MKKEKVETQQLTTKNQTLIMSAKVNIFRRIWLFYYEGFRSMTLGRTLWAIILIKLAIMFLVLKIFFFPSELGGKTDAEKADHVSNQLIERGIENK